MSVSINTILSSDTTVSCDNILSCHNISKSYQSRLVRTNVLKQVSLEFKEGSINLIYGKSGSGKTTLLNLLAGLDRVSSGDIMFQEKKYASMKEAELAKLRGTYFGFVFQAYHLIPRINVEENILCPSYVNGKQIDMTYYQFLIEELGIKGLVRKLPCELSGGEQQRVAIARAMLLKPKIVFADEPTGNLDTENTKMITSLFEKLNREYNTTFIIVTHEENLIEQCEQVIRLKDGEIVIE